MEKIFDLKKLAYFAIMAMPLYLVRVSFWGVPTNSFEILAILISGLIISGVVGPKINLGDLKKHIIPIIMILIGLSLSALYGDNYKVGLGIIKSWFVIPIIFSWSCVQIFQAGKDILKAIYSSAVIVACLSLVYFFAGAVTFDGRLEAFYNSPNFLAMYLAPAIMIGLFLMEENIKFYPISLLIIGISFYLTLSYAAWLAVFVSLIILIAIKKEALNWKMAAAALLAVGLFLSSQMGTEKMDRLVDLGARSSTSSRLMIWSSAWKIGLDNPIVGIGPGNFQDKYLEYQKYFPPYLEWAVPQPHNLFLAFWLQSGLLGAIGFFWLIFVWLKEFASMKEWRKEDYAFLGIMLCILIHGLADTTYFKNDLAVVFWLVFFAAKKRSLSKSV